MPDCFIASDHTNLASEQELYQILKKEGYAPRFVEKGTDSGKYKAAKRTKTTTYLLCQADMPRHECVLLSK